MFMINNNMRYIEIIIESAVTELKDQLPTLAKHDYNTIDKLMKQISLKHKISADALHDIFVKKYKKTPDNWIKNKLDETNSSELDIDQEVNQFVDWACNKLNISNKPKIKLSMDTDEAQGNHHTGGHVPGSGSIWVYAKNRNLVDILRTVFHELVHVRQHELDMIGNGDSYPGSPIEIMADAVAGKYIKIYGKKYPKIFQ